MRKGRLSILAGCLEVLVLLGLLLWPSAPAIAAPLHSFQLTHNEGEDSQPATGGEFLAWHHWDGSDWEIELVNLSTATSTEITSNGFGRQDQWPAVDPSGKYVVYTSHEGSDTSAMAMKLYDTQTKATTTIGVVDFRWEWGNPYRRLPQVVGDSVVWVGFVGDQTQVYLHTISTGSTQLLGPGYDPVLGDSFLAWSRTSAEIWTYDLATGKKSGHGFLHVTRGAMSPSILSNSGNLLLLRGAYADGSSSLALYDVSGSSASGGAFRDITSVGQLRSGALDGDWVAWTDAGGLWLADVHGLEPALLDPSPGLGELVMNQQGIGYSSGAIPNSRVFYYDLDSETTTCVSDGVSLGQNQDPCLWRNAVIWQGKDSADAELFMANRSGFVDVPSDYPYVDAIAGLSLEGVILGFDDSTFRPAAVVTRQQFAKMIAKALLLTVTGSEVCPFTDVADQVGVDSLYPSKYVAVCAARGITTGKTATTFDPTSGITRQQLITMVVRAAELVDPPPAYVPSFTAAQFSLDEHYRNARRAAYAGLLDGLLGIGSAYDFSGFSSRGECAQLLYNLSNR